MQEGGHTARADQISYFLEVRSSVSRGRVRGAEDGAFAEIVREMPKIVYCSLHRRLLENPIMDERFHFFETGILLSGNPGE
jgi:hypothetical protein